MKITHIEHLKTHANLFRSGVPKFTSTLGGGIYTGVVDPETGKTHEAIISFSGNDVTVECPSYAYKGILSWIQQSKGDMGALIAESYSIQQRINDQYITLE